MSETLNFMGSVDYASDARGNSPFPINLVYELDGWSGSKTVPVLAAGSVTVDLSGMADSDVVLIRTPRAVSVTVVSTNAGQTLENVVVQNLMILTTSNITSITIANTSTADIKVTYAAAKIST